MVHRFYKELEHVFSNTRTHARAHIGFLEMMLKICKKKG
jgi:hypothetical protein